MSEYKFLRLNGSQARDYVNQLANLRLTIFNDFPYLYEGNLDYEKKYLETYLKAEHSFIFLVLDNDKVIGATTGIWAKEEEDSLKKPFKNFGISADEVFYFGESLLLNEYRGQGIGKIFFEEREKFCKQLPFIKMMSFCAVVRDSHHPLKPQGYKPLDEFWKAMGFHKKEGLTTQYEWQDRGESAPTNKQMQYWIKTLDPR